MKQNLGGTRRVAAAVLAFGLTLVELCVAQEPVGTDFIETKTDRQCDEFNRSWVVTSRHTHLSIKVRVSWSAVGAKEMQEEFVLSPGAGRAIGCASTLAVVSAEIMQF